MFLNVLAVVTPGAMTGEVVEAVAVTWEEEEEILPGSFLGSGSFGVLFSGFLFLESPHGCPLGVVVYVESNVPR